jgi:small-conductance mechanosensitive channel
MPQGLVSYLQDSVGAGDMQRGILATFVAIALLWGLHTLVQRFLVKRINNPSARYSARKGAQYVTFVVGALLVGRIWYEGFDSFATFVGLVGAGLAIALRDPVANIAGWAFLVVRHPFRVGDRIRIGEHLGDVVDIGLFQFELHELGAWVQAEQATGRVIFVPNSFVFREPQLNYHRGLPYIWEELSVSITFESNWQAAKTLLEEIARRHAVVAANGGKKERPTTMGFFHLEGIVMSEVYTAVAQNGVVLHIRYAVEPRERRRKQMLVWEDVLRAFRARDDIRFAYNTYRRVDLGEPAASDASSGGST